MLKQASNRILLWEPFIAIRETMIEKPAIVPKGYHTVTPWIIAKGASGLVTFIENTFGGKEKEGSRILNADGSIGHVEVQLSDSVILLFDHQKGWPDTSAFLRVYVESAESVKKKAKDAGSTIVTDVTLLFFGEKSDEYKIHGVTSGGFTNGQK